MPFEKLITSRGNKYTHWVEPMPRIPDEICNSIIYLYADELSSEQGEDAGASGFLLTMNSPARKEASHVYAITNAHVIESKCTCVRINLKYPSSGNRRVETFPFKIEDWIIDETHDLAVCPFPTNFYTDHYSLTLINKDFLITKEWFKGQDIGPGDELVYVGRFVGHAGKLQNMPSVRFGTISMNPNVDEPVEYTCNKKKRKQVGFLVEARSKSGYSGSPVFFLEQHAINRPRLVWPALDMYLLGVDWGHIHEIIPIKLKEADGSSSETNWCAEINSGMMGVVPSWYLDEFIMNSPRLIAQRARDDEIYKNYKPNGSADNA